MGILIDSISSSLAGQSVSSLSWTHTMQVSPTGGKGLFVGTGARASVGNAANMVVSGITAGGKALTKIRSDELDPDSCFRTELWYLANPPQGSFTIQVTFTGSLTYCGAGALGILLMNQAVSFLDANAGNSDNSSTTPAVSYSIIAANCLLIDMVYSRSGTLTKDATQTLVAGITINADDNVGMSYKFSPGTGSQTMQWTESNDGNTWVISSVSISPQVSVGNLLSSKLRPRPFAPGLAR